MVPHVLFGISLLAFISGIVLIVLHHIIPAGITLVAASMVACVAHAMIYMKRGAPENAAVGSNT